MSSKKVYLDVETTGLDPFVNEVWEVGFIEHSKDMGWLHRLYRVYPDLTTASPDALRISGFYDRTHDMRDPVNDDYAVGKNAYNLVDGFTGEPEARVPLGGFLWSDPKALAALLAKTLIDRHVVGAVPWFDAALHGSFLSEFLRKNGQRLARHYHLIDVEAMAVGYLAGLRAGRVMDVPKPRLPWDSDALSLALGVDPDQFDRHSALGDARWAKALDDRITGTS
jgi:hypothetical protein